MSEPEDRMPEEAAEDGAPSPTRKPPRPNSAHHRPTAGSHGKTIEPPLPFLLGMAGAAA
jgi:hypothetical protein